MTSNKIMLKNHLKAIKEHCSRIIYDIDNISTHDFTDSDTIENMLCPITNAIINIGKLLKDLKK